MNFYITYGIAGKEVGHDYNGGYTFVHASDWNTAVEIWKAVHHRDKPYPLSCAFIYSEADLRRLGKTEDDLGVCHDTIIYQDRKE